MDELDARLHAARRGAAPGRDLWPGIERLITPSPRPAWWRQAAAAVLLFTLGTATGVILERERTAPAEGADGIAALPPLEAAAAVQRAGSEYVAAVARLDRLRFADEPARMQGYEAALVVIAVAAEEVTGAVELPLGPALVASATAVQGAAAERVASVRRGKR